MGKSSVNYALSTLVAVCLLLVTAHFIHNKLPWFAAVYLFLTVIFLFFREPVIAKITQGALIIAACEWVRAAFVLVTIRMQEGGSWIRLAVILLGVASVTFVSVAAFRNNSFKELYGLHKGAKPGK